MKRPHIEARYPSISEGKRFFRKPLDLARNLWKAQPWEMARAMRLLMMAGHVEIAYLVAKDGLDVGLFRLKDSCQPATIARAIEVGKTINGTRKITFDYAKDKLGAPSGGARRKRRAVPPGRS